MSRKREFEDEVLLDEVLDSVATQCPRSLADVVGTQNVSKRRRKGESTPEAPSQPKLALPRGEDLSIGSQGEESREETGDDVNDVLLALEGIFEMTSIGTMCCALQHQLYAIFANKTYVDQQVSLLRSAGVLRVFHCSVGTLLMKTDAYEKDAMRALQNHPARLANAFRMWLKYCEQTSVTHARLAEGKVHEEALAEPRAALSDNEVQMLQDSGVLLARRDARVPAYWIYHPRMGPTLTEILSLRKQIVAAIQRSRFKELSMKQIERLRLQHPAGAKYVPFSDSFFLQDLQGTGVLRLVHEASGGRVYRLNSSS